MSLPVEDDTMVGMTAQLQKAIVDRLEAWVKTSPHPEKPFIGAAGIGKGLSPTDVLRHVRERTTLGKQLMAGWMKLAIQREIAANLDFPGDEYPEDLLKAR
jgi:hypothetical protein